MWPLAIIKHQIATERCARVRHAVVSAQINLFVFHAPPQPFDKHVVTPGTFAIHADLDFVLEQNIGEGFAGELLLSVLKIVGRPYFASASSNASMQKSMVSVIESRGARTRRLNQSTIATR